MTYESLIRNANAILCTLVFAGLLWRMIGRWALSYPLGRVAVALFAALELIVALGTANRAAIGGPFNPAQYAITVHALVSLVLIAVWPRLARLGTWRGVGSENQPTPARRNDRHEASRKPA